MKHAEPQLNIEVIVGTILAVAFAFFMGYMVGLDHGDTNLRIDNMLLKAENARQKSVLQQTPCREGSLKKLAYDINQRRIRK